MTDQFTHPLPDFFKQDPQIKDWASRLTYFLDEISRPDGALDVVDATAQVTLTQQEKLDLIDISASIDLDAVKAAQDALRDGLPAYTITGDATDRVFNANAAAGAITSPPTQAEVEKIRDAVLELADVVATLINDLADKNVFGA